MTFRAAVYAGFALATMLPVESGATGWVATTGVTIEAAEEGRVGEGMPIACAATDPDGVQVIKVRVTSPSGVATVLGIGFGVERYAVTWAPPPVGGTYVVQCRAKGGSLRGTEAVADRQVVVRAPVVVDPPPPGGGTSGPGLSGDPVTLPGAPAVGTSVYQDRLPVTMRGPRRIAATAYGDLFVADASANLHRLTKRGEWVATALTGVAAVAAGGDVVFAALSGGKVLKVHPWTGRVLGEFDLSVSEPPVGMAYDEGRETLWVAFRSAVQQRRPDGTLVRHQTATGAGQLARVVDVTVSGGTAWVSEDHDAVTGLLHGYDAVTGEYQSSIGSGTAGSVQMAGGIAAAWGRLYVSDAFSSNVRVFEASSGTAIDMVTATVAGQIDTPAGLAFMANGDLLVASMGANRVDRFGVGAALPECAGDQDCDRLPDEWETANGMSAVDPRDAVTDADGDGLNETEEYAYGANPHAADTDGDGVPDAVEVATGYDPANAADHGPQLAVDVPAQVDPGVVQLTGTASGGGTCTVAWRQLSGPVVVLQGTAESPWFVARRGAYRFEAAATCGGVASAPAVVDVAVRNLPPRADGGRLVAVRAGEGVPLSGTFSTDVNGDVLHHGWDQVLGAAIFGGKAKASVTVRAETAGYYVFRLEARDAHGATDAAEVPVVVTGEAGTPTAVIASPVLGRVGEPVVLDASGSFRSAGASFAWEQRAGPAVTLAGEAPSFVPESAGRYGFAVWVVDGEARSPPAAVEVYVAPAGGSLPLAAASAPEVVAVDAPVTLDGTGSAAGTGSALEYAWRQVSGPAAGLTRRDRASASFVAFQPGSYELELTVSDEAAASVPARVRIEARANGVAIPRAVASGPGSAVERELVFLSGTGSTGAKGWRWTQVEGPWVAIRQGEVATFRPLSAGVYAFELEVDDGTVRSAPARVEVVVQPNGTGN